MIPAFTYFFIRSLINRVRFRLNRMRQPKYIVSVIAGAAYIYFIFFQRIFADSSSGSQVFTTIELEYQLLWEGAFASLLLVMILYPWVFSTKARGISFSEAEIQFLFPSPISRRTLLNFRIFKIQVGILFGVLISGFLLGRSGWFPHPAYLLITLWIIYSFLALYRMGTDLSKASLIQHGITGFKRQIWIIVLLFGSVVMAAVWVIRFLPSPPNLDTFTPQGVAEWLMLVLGSLPVKILLMPFLCLIRPAFAQDLATFILRVLPAMGILGLAYIWVIRSDTSFEEASLERARKTATRLEATRRGGGEETQGAASGKACRPLFHLHAVGPFYTAIFWKNLLAVGRLNPHRLLPIITILVLLTIVLSIGGESRWNAISSVIGMAAAMGAVLLTLLGPVIIRDDLRTDLLRVDLLKTYPIRGWSVVLGEVLAPAVILGFFQWGLILIAGLLMPPLAEESWSLYHRFLFGLSAAILLPCITAIGVLIQNGMVLIMPGWIQLGREHKRGVEAMGQRLITMAATLLVMLFAVVPGSLLLLITFFAGYWLIGLAVLPIAAIIAALGILIEAGLGILGLGRIYDKFDASQEMAEL